jgi:hypothetical protein
MSMPRDLSARNKLEMVKNGLELRFAQLNNAFRGLAP